MGLKLFGWRRWGTWTGCSRIPCARSSWGDTCNRDRASARLLNFPGTWDAENFMLYCIAVKTICLVTFMISPSLQLCLLITCTIALLSQWKLTYLLAILIPKIWIATIIGKNSRKAMFFFCHSLGHSMTNQSLLNVAAHAILLASEYMFRVKEFSFFVERKSVFPLWNLKKRCHILMSARASTVIVT